MCQARCLKGVNVDLKMLVKFSLLSDDSIFRLTGGGDRGLPNRLTGIASCLDTHDRMLIVTKLTALTNP